MAVYLDLCERVARSVAEGELAPGAALPAVRALARRHGTTSATVSRAYAELARAGVIVTSPRRASRVAHDGPVLARRLLRGGRALRFAGSDDPALDLLLAAAAGEVDRIGARGSLGGLTALWQGSAEAAALHLRHVGGDYNAPFASRILAGREPVLVRLWRREQGIAVAAGNPCGISRVDDLLGRTVALRPVGTGTRVLLERLLRERRLDPVALHGPEVGSHLDVALAVSSGVADAGVAVRSAAALLGLDFIPLAWEPFEVVLPAQSLAGVAPLVDALTAGAARIEALEGYDLEGAGRVLHVR